MYTGNTQIILVLNVKFHCYVVNAASARVACRISTFIAIPLDGANKDFP